jgi:hypothetical protein
MAPGDDADVGSDKMRGLFRIEHEARCCALCHR